MDRLDLPRAEAERALRDLSRVNRWLFGFTPLLRTLLPRLEHAGSPPWLLDLGAGTGELAAVLERAARKRGLRLRCVDVDRKLAHLLIGRRQGHAALAVVAAADALPFPDRGLAWSFSTLFLHHFDESDGRQVLEEMARVASRGAVVVDLRHSRLASLLIRISLPLLGVGPVAAHDGKLSTDQAWTIEEARRLAAGLRVLELRRRFPFRFSLIVTRC